MLIDRIRDLRCPRSGSPLTLVEPVLDGRDVRAGTLVSSDGGAYRIEDGVPNFVDTASLTAIEARTRSEYDRVAEGIYDVAVDWQFAAMYEDEHAVRESMIELLEIAQGGKVLEIGCGTGRDSFRLARRLGPDGWLHMQDLSPQMVRACARRMSESRGFACALDYSVSNAASLPFQDGLFDAVFHFGGFNQFGDLRKGAAELTRVARLAGRIVIGDEAVAPWLKGTEFEGIVTTNNPLFKSDAPLDVLPVSARDVSVRWIIGNCFYLIAFSKGDGPPPLNLDLAHEGWRGGTMRSRYFGMLEGVSVEAKALATEAAAKAGLSLHDWLDRIVRTEAAAVLGRKP